MIFMFISWISFASLIPTALHFLPFFMLFYDKLEVVFVICKKKCEISQTVFFKKFLSTNAKRIWYALHWLINIYVFLLKLLSVCSFIFQIYVLLYGENCIPHFISCIYALKWQLFNKKSFFFSSGLIWIFPKTLNASFYLSYFSHFI